MLTILPLLAWQFVRQCLITTRISRQVLVYVCLTVPIIPLLVSTLTTPHVFVNCSAMSLNTITLRLPLESVYCYAQVGSSLIIRLKPALPAVQAGSSSILQPSSILSAINLQGLVLIFVWGFSSHRIAVVFAFSTVLSWSMRILYYIAVYLTVMDNVGSMLITQLTHAYHCVLLFLTYSLTIAPTLVSLPVPLLLPSATTALTLVHWVPGPAT